MDEKIKEGQIARIIGIDTQTCQNEKMLTVQAVLPKKEHERGGSEYGRVYEWPVNKYVFTYDQEESMRAFRLSVQNYLDWKNKR